MHGCAMNEGLRRVTSGVLAAACTLFAGGAMGQGSAAVLKFVPQADLRSLDPIATSTFVTRNHGLLVFDTLFAIDEKFEPKPQMVESFQVSPDLLKYRFVLRDGLAWHDGSPVTAEDCVESIKRWARRDSLGQQIAERLTRLVAIHPRTIELELKSPYPLMLYALGKSATPMAFMMPKRLAATPATENIKEMIGSGPYRFAADQWVPGSKVVYLKNEAYKPRSEPASFMAGAKIARVNRIEWHILPDAVTARNALVNGEVDFLETVAPDLAPTLKNVAGVRLEVRDTLGSQGTIRVNNLQAPFNHIKARQALLALVDSEKYLKSLSNSPEFYRPCRAWFGCGTPYESDAGVNLIPTGGVQRARELIKESGYKGEKVVILHATDYAMLDGPTQLTASLLREAGMNVEVQSMDFGAIANRRNKKEATKDGGWSIFFSGGPIVDFMIAASNNNINAGCESKAWFGWPCDERIEQLRNEWALAPTLEARKEVTGRLQTRLYEFAPFVFYGQWFVPSAYRENVTGLLKGPVPLLWNLEKK